MAKIQRYDGNLKAFAADSPGTERTIFGSETQDDTLDANLNTDFFRGWGIVPPSGEPALQDFNAAFYTLGQLLSYLHQSGVAEWNGSQEYHDGSVAMFGGIPYVCQTNDHVSVTNPASDGVNWSRVAMEDYVESVSTPVGGYVTVQTNLTGAEEPDPGRYIKLEAGLMGVGEYNEGKLGNESVTGTAPLVEATAEIVDSESPMFGQVVDLVETSRRFFRAGLAGTVENDQMQRITGRFSQQGHDNSVLEGSFSLDSISSGNTGTGTSNHRIIGFDSANSPSARVSGTTDGETRAKNIGVSVYMRIK